MPERQRSDAGSVNRLSASGRKRAKEGTLHLRLSGATNLRARVTGVGYYYPTISYPVILSSYHPILSPYHPSILLSYHPITLSSYYPITLPYHPILTSYHPIRSYPIFLSYHPILSPYHPSILLSYHPITLSSHHPIILLILSYLLILLSDPIRSSYPIVLSSFLSSYPIYHPITYHLTILSNPILASYHPIRSYPIFLSHCPIILPIHPTLYHPNHLIILSNPLPSRGPLLPNGVGAKGGGEVIGSGNAKQQASDSLAEWSKALAPGASPQGRGFEPHSCHFLLSFFFHSLRFSVPEHAAAAFSLIRHTPSPPSPGPFC